MTYFIFSLFFIINFQLVALLNIFGERTNNEMDPAILIALSLASRNRDRARDNIPNIVKLPIQLNGVYGERRSSMDKIKNFPEEDYIPSVNSTIKLFDLLTQLIKKMVD